MVNLGNPRDLNVMLMLCLCYKPHLSFLHIHICGVMECMSSLSCNFSRKSLHFTVIWSPVVKLHLLDRLFSFALGALVQEWRAGVCSLDGFSLCHFAFENLRIREVGKCISFYLTRHQVNIWAAWIVKKLWGLHHIVEIHLLCKNIRWIWNNQSSPFVYRKNLSKKYKQV